MKVRSHCYWIYPHSITLLSYEYFLSIVLYKKKLSLHFRLQINIAIIIDKLLYFGHKSFIIRTGI